MFTYTLLNAFSIPEFVYSYAFIVLTGKIVAYIDRFDLLYNSIVKCNSDINQLSNVAALSYQNGSADVAACHQDYPELIGARDVRGGLCRVNVLQALHLEKFKLVNTRVEYDLLCTARQVREEHTHHHVVVLYY